MTGYYAIYNHNTNAWLMHGGIWQLDRHIEEIHLPTQIQLNEHWIADSVGDYKKDYKLLQTEYKNILVKGTEMVNPFSILKFSKLSDAEDYLLSGAIVSGGDFFTIRKIYF